ncbi:polysaccharide pyruvyl transferase family protein [Vibrio porteresiae]|uniref:Polysaccharide pyruvyl transferase family protein n=1 Tax=Vibrio porteresiae DSM 19223 TaxID=1123496 RepID=A0ABZ0QAD0_9VIBR|nr:polysaccharide pyruvyl transferase family protein [Vibrio porteresiae]WPC72885.1 polysaccharide pyruvyl transferase family protein [Vibrio porteresiae DSM 19223]
MVKIFRVTPGNFGDDLNEVLIQRRLGKQFQGNVFLNVDNQYDVSANDTLVVAIGTILNELVPAQGTKILLGAGYGYGQPALINERWDVKFVRGHLTAKKLGLDSHQVITDPAILLANNDHIYNVIESRVGYVPHHGVANRLWERACQDLGLKYIDPRRSYQQVMDDLLSCKWVIAEAMHGAIVADALRIPWIAVSSAEKINTFKWNDWCSTIGLEYHPIKLMSLWPSSDNRISKRLITGVKEKTVRLQLNKIIKHGIPQLSSDAVFRSNLGRVTDCYERFFSSVTN